MQSLIMFSVFVITCIHLVSKVTGQDCVSSHNYYRQFHEAPALVYSEKIENYAIERAEYLALTDIFSHPSNLKYGENLYWVKGKEPTCEDAVTAWYREILKYDFEKPRFSHDTGHFTQVVWRNTTQIGCAASQSPKTKKIYIVCNYYYPGNVLKHFKENVLYPSYW